MAFAIMRMAKIKSCVEGNARMKHNRREIACVTSNPDKKDICLILGDRMREDKNKTFTQIFHERTKGQKIRSNAVYSLEIVLTFSSGGIAGNLNEWVKTNADWLRKHFGEENIIDCRLHLSEKTPHIHAMILPIDENGKLNCRRYTGGNKHKMSEFQDDYGRAMEKFGLERGICRTLTKAQHESSLRWHAMQAVKEERLKQYERVYGNEFKSDTATQPEYTTR